MTQTVYLKLSQITQVHEKNVPLASLGEVYCSEKSVESRCRAMIMNDIVRLPQILHRCPRNFPFNLLDNLHDVSNQTALALFSAATGG